MVQAARGSPCHPSLAGSQRSSQAAGMEPSTACASSGAEAASAGRQHMAPAADAVRTIAAPDGNRGPLPTAQPLSQEDAFAALPALAQVTTAMLPSYVLTAQCQSMHSLSAALRVCRVTAMPVGDGPLYVAVSVIQTTAARFLGCVPADRCATDLDRHPATIAIRRKPNGCGRRPARQRRCRGCRRKQGGPSRVVRHASADSCVRTFPHCVHTCDTSSLPARHVLNVPPLPNAHHAWREVSSIARVLRGAH